MMPKQAQQPCAMRNRSSSDEHRLPDREPSFDWIQVRERDRVGFFVYDNGCSIEKESGPG